MSESQNENRDNNEEKKDQQPIKTSSGLDENLAGLLTYLVGFITGIIFLLIEKDSRFVRFHALQSIFVSVGLFVLNIILSFIPIIGWGISLLIAPFAFVLWIFLMIQAYQGKWFKLPVIGDMVEKQLNNMDNN
ncbi:DUF4870 domain-containing protein [Ornithinibacillus halotolerans]|uniref:Membrane protein n=1 Tax=Ornithinibacillus halotolerans TaxID=1274357 RepID=A0A916W794_9BACI|nr:DUF4870 domain-containing protein [Ornithinibacillus halotolerans]GGA72543.1 membrane protein [Ornithinibacillus halotolerans]